MWRELFKHGPIGVVFVIVMAALMGVGGIFLTRTLGVAQADAEREVFLETQSYHQGMIRDLGNLRLEFYRSETAGQRAAVASTFLHRVRDIDTDDLPDDLAQFADSLIEASYQP